MAKLVEVYRNDQTVLMKRQLPLVINEGLTMVMDINGLGCVFASPGVRTRDFEKFMDMFLSLPDPALRAAFNVSCKDFFDLLRKTIPCVGCRRSVERLYEQLRKSGHPALEPLVISSDGTLSIQEKHLSCPKLLCAILHGHSERLTELVETLSRSKKSHRCFLHSLDYQRIRTSWTEVWEVMKPECREQILLIHAAALLITLENYLQKHRFCADCRTKVLRAYWLLVEEPEPAREKGYVPSVYNGIKRCLPEKHIHLPTSTEFVSNLVARAQPDVMSSGERHAKTLEIAQGEVMTCLGLVVYERLHRIQVRLKEEEVTCQVLAAVAIDALSRKFQTDVETKRGISNSDIFCKELTKQEFVKQQKKEQKKLKKKKRKEKKAGLNITTEDDSDVNNETLEDPSCLSTEVDDTEVPGMPDFSCNKCGKTELGENKLKIKKTLNEGIDKENVCLTCKKNQEKKGKNKDCLCEYSNDCGYSSGNNNASYSSPEGSDIACEEFCSVKDSDCKENEKAQTTETENVSIFTSYLEQMLEDTTSSDEESFIPLEDVREFQSRDNIPEKRAELRQILKMRFAQMCNNPKY